MKTLSYPKIYATYIDTTVPVGHFTLLGKTYVQWVYRFVTDNGEAIDCRPSKRGHTPRRVYNEWRRIKEGMKPKACEEFGRHLMPPGTRVKLFKKAGRWYFSYLGQ